MEIQQIGLLKKISINCMKIFRELSTNFIFIPYLLGFLGLIPFIYFSFIDNYLQIFTLEDRFTFIITYAAIIFSFLGGIHWGVILLEVNNTEKYNRYRLRFTISVIPSVLGWVALFLHEYHGIILLLLSYLLILFYDFITFRFANLFIWYFFLRSILTFIAVTSLLNIFYLLI